MASITNSTSSEASSHHVEDTSFSNAFLNVADAAEGYLDYDNDPIFKSCVDSSEMNDTDAFKQLAHAAIAYMRHEVFSWKTEGNLEFRKIARAATAYIECDHPFEPMNSGYHRILPHALQIVYQHMGLAPIDQVEFILLADTYRVYDPSYLIDSWSWESPYEIGAKSSTIDILACRGVPSAVRYMHLTTDGLDPIELVAFRDVAEAAEAYRLFENDFDNWDDRLVAAFREISEGVVQWLAYENGYEPLDVTTFKELAAAVEGHLSYEVPPYFPHFLQLPPEIRGMVTHQYLLDDRAAGQLSKHQHSDWWGCQCCVWEYPEALIACDNQDPSVVPNPETARCPQGWLPMLAFTSKQMLGEVAVYMLQNTERIDLKYVYQNTDFKIATWFRKFLEAIPGGDGATAVKHLNFPHMHWFNYMCHVPALSNPSVELMVACSNLRKVDMTFHYTKVSVFDEDLGRRVPKSVDEILDQFDIRPILKCRSLERVYFDGIYDRPSRGGDQSHLDALVELGKWIVKGFIVEQERNIEVEVHRRSGAWDGRVPGVLVVLTKEEEEEARSGSS
ncbi:Nn.00g056280.m01.CDS01 [Neocucurbitaria sp. VM-36]